jgi:hypothetical protein
MADAGTDYEDRRCYKHGKENPDRRDLAILFQSKFSLRYVALFIGTFTPFSFANSFASPYPASA